MRVNFSKKWRIQNTLPYLLIVGAIVGLFASFTLTIEHINLLKDPNYQLSCSIDPVLACGPIMQSNEATIFGFPNPLIGLVIFGAQLLLGIAMLAGSKLKSWFWKLFGLGLLGGLGFTIWLIWHSLYSIGAICIYCLIVWVVMFAVAWYVFQFMLAEKHIKTEGKIIRFIRNHHLDILLAWFILIAGLILIRFWYYYGPKLGF